MQKVEQRTTTENYKPERTGGYCDQADCTAWVGVLRKAGTGAGACTEPGKQMSITLIATNSGVQLRCQRAKIGTGNHEAGDLAYFRWRLGSCPFNHRDQDYLEDLIMNYSIVNVLITNLKKWQSWHPFVQDPKRAGRKLDSRRTVAWVRTTCLSKMTSADLSRSPTGCLRKTTTTANRFQETLKMPRRVSRVIHISN